MEPQATPSSNDPNQPVGPPASAPPQNPLPGGHPNVQSVYPEPTATPTTPSPKPDLNSDVKFNVSNDIMSEALAAILGVASSIGYILLIFIVKNGTVSRTIGALLALAAIVFAYKAYGRNDKMTPLTVIGLSAATITLISIGNYLVSRAFYRSFFDF